MYFTGYIVTELFSFLIDRLINIKIKKNKDFSLKTPPRISGTFLDVYMCELVLNPQAV